jgi:hypothetical protein
VGIAAAPGRRSRGEEERKGEGRRLTSETQSSAKGKEKKKREAAWAGTGRGWWAAGPPGQKGGEGLLCFFSFSFSNSFQVNLLNSNSNQIFFKLFTKFYNLFRSHTSNQKPYKAK